MKQNTMIGDFIMEKKISAWKLDTDEKIKAAFESEKTNIYWRDGDEGSWENIKVGNHDLDIIIDGTCFGFNLIATNDLDTDYIDEDSDIEFICSEEDNEYDDR